MRTYQTFSQENMRKIIAENNRNPVASMKERIVKESIRLFLRKGFKGTSIQNITETLGITKGAFYWHFVSKEELLETIIDKYDEEFLEKLYEYINSLNTDFVKTFREYHKYINEYARSNGEFCVLFVHLAAEMAGSNSPGENRIKRVLGKYLAFIESLLKKGKNEGFFPEEYDITMNSHIIIAFHSGILLQWYINRKDIDGTAMARTYRDAILYGMAKTPRK
jgi:AcrR family transcriptional regulator